MVRTCEIFPPFLGNKEINDETMVTKHHFQEMKI